MTRKNDGSKDPRKGAARNGHASEKSGKNGAGGKNGSAEIISLASSPAFDLWLERNTRKLVEASTTRPSQSLVDLIRNWGGNSPKKSR